MINESVEGWVHGEDNRENSPKGEWMRRLLVSTTYGISEFSIKWNRKGEGAIAFI